MKFLKKKPAFEKVVLLLPNDLAARLQSVQARAESEGFDLDLTSLVSKFVASAESELSLSLKGSK
jgi:hypothetical protein